MGAFREVVVVASLAAACAACPRSGASWQRPGAATVPGLAAVDTIWLIFVDDLHLEFRDTGRIRAFLSAIASDLVREGDLCVIASSGPSNLSIGLTSNRTVLEAAIRHSAGAALAPRDILAAMIVKPVNDEVSFRAGVALAAARDMLATVRHAPSRRKAVLYISRGYGFEPPAPGDRTTDTSAARGPAISTPELRRRFAALVEEARRAGARIFTIDPPGAENTAAPADPAGWDLYVVLTQRNRRALSEQTGGVALTDVQDAHEVAKRMRDALR